MKMTLIDKNALIQTMRKGFTPLPDKEYDRAKNKIINDLIEEVRAFPEADLSEYQRMQKECKHYKELCYSLELFGCIL